MSNGINARLDRVFGGLTSELNSSGAAPWRPSPQQVFRGGANADEYSDDADGEYQEQLRPEEYGEINEEDVPDEEGYLPSAAFLRQLDQEAEEDATDVVALAHVEQNARPDNRTEVLEGNIYDQHLAMMEGSAPMDEDMAPSEPSSTPSPPSTGGHLTPSSSQSLKSNLRRGPRPEGGIKKRVSFTGIPEPPKAWVPPHKRANFVSKFGSSGTLPPSPEQITAAVMNAKMAKNKDATEEDDQGTSMSAVADYVINPQRYTRYDLDEPVVVGGGVQQLSLGDKGQSVENVVETIRAAGGSWEERMEEEQLGRWQGAVGGGIEFRPRHASGTGRKEDTEKGERQLGVTSFEWEGDEDEEEVMDVGEGLIENAKMKKSESERRKYRKSRIDSADEDMNVA